MANSKILLPSDSNLANLGKKLGINTEILPRVVASCKLLQDECNILQEIHVLPRFVGNYFPCEHAC